MCAATENFKHPDYVDWVKYIYLSNYLICSYIIYRYAVTNVLHGYTLNVLMKTSPALHHTTAWNVKQLIKSLIS